MTGGDSNNFLCTPCADAGPVTDCSRLSAPEPIKDFNHRVPMEPRPTNHPWYQYHTLDWNNIHGISGALFLLFTALEVLQFAFTLQPSTPLRLANLALSISLYYGVFRSEIRKREAPMGMMLNRLGAWNIAYIALSKSIYTTPAEYWVNGELPLINMIGTAIFPLAILDSLMILFSEIQNRQFVMQGFVVENIVTYTYLLAMPLLHLCIGTDELADLYVRFNLAETVYIHAVFTAFIDSIDSFHICQVSARKLEKDSFHSISTLIWAFVHSPGSAFFVGSINGAKAGAYFYAASFLIYLVGTMLEHLLERSKILEYHTLEEVRLSKMKKQKFL
jgi:hypothetical protein